METYVRRYLNTVQAAGDEASPTDWDDAGFAFTEAMRQWNVHTTRQAVGRGFRENECCLVALKAEGRPTHYLRRGRSWGWSYWTRVHEAATPMTFARASSEIQGAMTQAPCRHAFESIPGARAVIVSREPAPATIEALLN